MSQTEPSGKIDANLIVESAPPARDTHRRRLRRRTDPDRLLAPAARREHLRGRDLVPGPVRGTLYNLQTNGETRTWEIGRAENLDIVILDPTETVSGQHAQLVNEGPRWKIVNWMSTNGTFVNGRKGLSTYLKSGDIIRLGKLEFAFEIKAVREQPGTVGEVSTPQSSSLGKWLAVGIGVLVSISVLFLILS